MKRSIPTIVAFALLAPAAHAQSPSEGYGEVVAARATAPAATAQQPAADPATGSGLPFTGIDAAAIALGGAALLGVGGALRHVTRHRAG